MEQAYGLRPPVREILERHVGGDVSAAADYERLFVFGDDDAGNFERFLAKFDLLVTPSAMTPFKEAQARVAEVVTEVRYFADAIRADHMRNGIAYAETRVLLGATLDSPVERGVLSVLLERFASHAGGITERLAPSLPRADPWPAWERIQQLALGSHGEALTGIDFCHVEEGHPPSAKAEFFAAVHEFNDRHPDRALAVLYHVGESFTDKSLESAVRWVQEAAELGAHRLGHAIALGVDPAVHGMNDRTELASERRAQIAYDLRHAAELGRAGVAVDASALAAEDAALAAGSPQATVTHHYDEARLDALRRRQEVAMAHVRRAGAVIEVCPTSNRRIGGITDAAHHPLHRFLEHGLRVVVASDDPGIFGTDLATELAWVADAAGLDADDRVALAEESWRYRSEVVSGRTPTSV